MRSRIYKYAAFSFITLTGLLFLTQCTDQLAGSEVKNEERACVYNPDGKTPAVSASVEVIPVEYAPIDDSSSSKLFNTTTDNNGVYTIKGIPEGHYYNVIARKGTYFSFQDSVYLDYNGHLKNDTLGAPGSFTARILVQPNDNPQSAVIQVLGTTSYFTNVNTSGWFTLPQLPAGSYQLKIDMENKPDYTTTIYNVKIHSGKSDTLVDSAITLIYTGIPVVTGLKAVYNPLTKVVALSWNKVDYKKFYDYLILYGATVPVTISMDTIGSTKDTFFFDTLSKHKIDTSASVIGLHYQIVVRDSSGKPGEKSNVQDVTIILSKKAGILLPSDTTTFVPNDSFKLSIVTDKALGDISHYYFKIDSAGSFREFTGPDTNLVIAAPGDSVIDKLSCIVKVTTSQGINVFDTLRLKSMMAWDKVASPFGSNVTGFYSVVYNGTMMVFTENSTKKSVALWNSTDGVVWKKLTDSLPFSSMDKQPIVFNDKLWVLDRDSSYQNATIWSSSDGQAWDSKQIDSLPNKGYKGVYEVWCTYGNKIVIINYFPDCFANGNCGTGTPNCWSSENGINWGSHPISGSLFPDRLDNPNKNYIACELNGNLYVGGAWRAKYLTSPASDAYYFKFWNQLQTDPGIILFPPPRDKSMISEYNPQIVVFKGALYMSAQVNMESSISATNNTKYFWKLMPDNRWVLCSDTYPALNSSAMNSNYHSLCSFNDRLYSISNAGVWRVRR